MGLLLRAQQAEDIDQLLHGQQSAAYVPQQWSVGSATLSAGVGG